jgi:hypothetical protein
MNSSVVDFDVVGAMVDGPWPGRSSAVRLGVNDQNSWILIGEAAKFKNLSSFTVEVTSFNLANILLSVCFKICDKLTTCVSTDVVLPRSSANSVQNLPPIFRAREYLLAA